jgi:Holliday junction DNA helicase RuvA
MFAHLNGIVSRIEANAVVIDVGGVGYRVSVPVSALASLPAVGGKALLHIHTYIRPEEISLYGFTHPEDQRIFELLLSVSGIGPKVALSILSAMDADTLARSVASEDTKTLVRIPGLGMKTAQRLVLELKDKLAAFALERRVDVAERKLTAPTAHDILDDVVEGLIGLGYNRNDARKAAERALKDISDKTNMADALRAALNILTGVVK